MREIQLPAHDLADNIRYSGDTLRASNEGHSRSTQHILETINKNDLRVSPAVTPGLFLRLENVCQRLGLSESAVSAFIYASPNIQAECYAGDMKNCILRFSSGLVDLLVDEEFEFVVGHEAGHFLLGHGLSRGEADDQSLEFSMQQRAQEISVDRIGLIACGSLDVAIRAMMKTVSGLSEKHLRYDVGGFLRQLDASSKGGRETTSTHPSFLIRCRALLWFSLIEAFNRGDNNFEKADISRIDKFIERDMAKFVDGEARRAISYAEHNLLVWVLAEQVVQDRVLDKHEQIAIANLIGDDTLARLKNFLSDIPAADIQDEVFMKLKAARDELERLAPSSFEKSFRDIQEKARAALR
jgi:hypothetical protein